MFVSFHGEREVGAHRGHIGALLDALAVRAPGHHLASGRINWQFAHEPPSYRGRKPQTEIAPHQNPAAQACEGGGAQRVSGRIDSTDGAPR
jgi:hypothetical protein